MLLELEKWAVSTASPSASTTVDDGGSNLGDSSATTATAPGTATGTGTGTQVVDLAFPSEHAAQRFFRSILERTKHNSSDAMSTTFTAGSDAATAAAGNAARTTPIIIDRSDPNTTTASASADAGTAAVPNVSSVPVSLRRPESDLFTGGCANAEGRDLVGGSLGISAPADLTVPSAGLLSIRLVNAHANSAAAGTSAGSGEQHADKLSELLAEVTAINNGKLSGAMPSSSALAHPSLSSGSGLSGTEWMLCWVHLDQASTTLTLYDNGPDSQPAFAADCSAATLLIPDMSAPSQRFELYLVHCGVTAQQELAYTQQEVSISIAISFQHVADMWRWVLALLASAGLHQLAYNRGGELVHVPAMHVRDILQSANDEKESLALLPPVLTEAPSWSTQLTESGLAAGRGPDSGSGAFLLSKRHALQMCFGVVDALAERRVCSTFLQQVSVSGAALKTCRFSLVNSRVVLMMKGACAGVTEGSVVLSVSGVSALSVSGNTVLKFIADLPRAMTADLTLMRFPHVEFSAHILEVAMPVSANTRSFPAGGGAAAAVANGSGGIDSGSGGSYSPPRLNLKLPGSGSGTDGIVMGASAEGNAQLERMIIRKRSSILIHTPVAGDSTPTGGSSSTAAGATPAGAAMAGSANAAGVDPHQLPSMAEFSTKRVHEMPWNGARVLISAGTVTLLRHDVPAGTTTPTAEATTRPRVASSMVLGKFPLSNCSMAFAFPARGTSLVDLCIELQSSVAHVLIRCPDLRQLLALAETLAAAMKLTGALHADLPHLYQQALFWAGRDGSESARSAGNEAASICKDPRAAPGKLSAAVVAAASSVVGRSPLDRAPTSHMVSHSNHSAATTTTTTPPSSRLPIRGPGGRSSLLVRSLESLMADRAEVMDNAQQQQQLQQSMQRGASKDRGALYSRYSPAAKANAAASAAAVVVATRAEDDRQSNSVLRAAEELEAALSQLQLPLQFPSASTIEKQTIELFKMSNAHHRLLAEFLILQVRRAHIALFEISSFN